MAASPTVVSQDQAANAASQGPIPFDISKPPIIEGFTPLPRHREEGFKDKFIRKTKENPFVPIGKLKKASTVSIS